MKIGDLFHGLVLQYFLPFGLESINRHIEKAILDADAKGIKVISLAALNKNEVLNGGGLLFVKKHPNLRVRVVHGNTLTAAVIIKTLPEGTKEVFMNGATSKLGRAIALYLCCRGIRVLVRATVNSTTLAIDPGPHSELLLLLLRTHTQLNFCK